MGPVSAFQLSWEEFLEINQDSLPVPSVASFVAMIFIAIAVGAFGVVLTYAVEPASKTAASSFCWMSLALFAAAFWDLRVRAAKRRTASLRELRVTYEHYYSGERNFAFDDEGWTLETQTGKQSGLWSALLTAAEWRNVITLSARDQLSAVVPKRALTAERLDSLLCIAIRPSANTWESRMSLVDYLVTEVPSLWRRHPFLMAEAHAAGLFFFAMIANEMHQTAGPGVFFGWIVAGLFLFLTLTTQFSYFLIKYLTSHKDSRTPWQVGFSEKGVYIRTSKVGFLSDWSCFRKMREATRCFLLYVDASMYYTFPKKCIPAEQLSTVRELLAARLPRD